MNHVIRFNRPRGCVAIGVALCVAAMTTATYGEESRHLDHPGYRLLLDKAYLPAEFDQKAFDDLWRTWEGPLREKAQDATPSQRRAMAFSRYGLTPRPGDEAQSGGIDPREVREGDDKPLQYVVEEGRWSINCLACHGGKVGGRVMPGLPNSHYAMQTLYDDIRTIKLFQGRLSRHDIAASLFPRGGSIGTTNAVMFGVAVIAVRDADLNFDRPEGLPKFVHHDVDAPPWWHLKRKRWLYADGSVENDHRALITFVLASEQNTGPKVRGWEDDFKSIYAWIKTLEPPKYPYSIDHELAARGKTVFTDHCARCHGTYGEGGAYPNKIVDIEDIGTDRARLDALSDEHLRSYEKSWLSHHGRKKVNRTKRGYVAQPLDGIWSTAPYFHNGSVPTLWHVLHPDDRPAVWRRSEDGYDRRRVGLEVTALDELPATARTAAAKRTYFDTRKFGKSAAGHRYPDALTPLEKRAVLEYLKTL